MHDMDRTFGVFRLLATQVLASFSIIFLWLPPKLFPDVPNQLLFFC